jgi:hypothetical protein
MSDAVFLRTNISSMIYADQINTAQISGSQAARDRAMRVQEEAMKEAQSQIQSVEELDKLDVREEEERRRQEQHAFDEQEEQAQDGEAHHVQHEDYDAAGSTETKAPSQTPKPRHIDLTI